MAQSDSRVKAILGLAAPMQNPLLPGVDVTKLTVPTFLLLAREDNSITELGNQLIRNNFEAMNAAVWKLEIDDAGHFSVSDLAGFNQTFAPGCGSGLRQTNEQPFDYLPIDQALHITKRWTSAFFAAQLQAEPTAINLLASPPVHKSAHIARRNSPAP